MTHVAVIDIGKTNAKLILVETDRMSEVAVLTRPNRVLPGPPYPHYDVEGIWEFLLDGLTRLQRQHGIRAISIVTHGASGVLLDAKGDLAAPVLDYEHTGPDTSAAAYDALRPDFQDTGSPRLPAGLNLGAQVHWLLERDPHLADRVACVLTYPQYWAHHLTGIVASDVSSLGCHTDFWKPRAGEFSDLVDRLGLSGKMAPPRPSADVLGPVRPDIAQQTGLPADTPVHCGIHDSNASLLPHLVSHRAPFSVVSSGTWVIAMAVGGRPVELDPRRDTLINVSAFGDAVPSARFMGGREFDLMVPPAAPEPTARAVDRVLAERTMLLPAVVPESGPFQGRRACWRPSEPAAESAERRVAVGFYLALMTATCLDLIGHEGPIILEGPFCQNSEYCRMLSAATAHPVSVAEATTTGTSYGATLLCQGLSDPDPDPNPQYVRAFFADVDDTWGRYAAEWRSAVESLTA